jgi:hypothetical protein
MEINNKSARRGALMIVRWNAPHDRRVQASWLTDEQVCRLQLPCYLILYHPLKHLLDLQRRLKCKAAIELHRDFYGAKSSEWSRSSILASSYVVGCIKFSAPQIHSFTNHSLNLYRNIDSETFFMQL